MSSKTGIGFCRWFQELVAIYCSDDIILNLLQALLAITNKEKSNESFGWLETSIKQRLETIHEIKDICAFNFDDKINKRALQISGYLWFLQTKEEQNSKWFNTQRYIFVRSLLRLEHIDKSVTKAINHSLKAHNPYLPPEKLLLAIERTQNPNSKKDEKNPNIHFGTFVLRANPATLWKGWLSMCEREKLVYRS